MPAICLAWSAAAGASPAAAAKPPLELAPAGEWKVHSGSMNCQLSRVFGHDAEAMLLRLDSFDVNGTFVATVGGKPLSRYNRDRLALSFGPGGRSAITGLYKGSVGSYAPGVYVGPITLLQSDGEQAAAADDRAAAQAIRWVELASKGMRPIRLLVGDMTEPLALMRACGEAHPAGFTRHLALPKPSKPPVPLGNPGHWLTPADYPPELVRQGAQGTVIFRLTIDAKGLPTECRVFQETRPAGFGAAVCAAMMRRARFDPALDERGQPIVASWQSSARFMMRP